MRLLSNIWARITGADPRAGYPQQQAVALDRTGDFIIVSPYGLYCDLPDNALLRVIAPGIAIPVTVDRPDDAGRDEPTIFHPATNTRVIFRSDGSLDVETGNGGTAPVRVNCTTATITASNGVTVDTPLASFTGDVDIAGSVTVGGAVTAVGVVTGSDLGAGGVTYKNHTHSQGNDSGGSAEVETNAPTGA